MASEASVIRFSIPGPPAGKGRPRFSTRGGFVRAHTPEKTEKYENLVKLSASQVANASAAFVESLQATIDVRVMPPPSWSQKKRTEAICGSIHPTTKPDLDNIAKAILDAMNGIVYLDDKQVVRLLVTKRYAEVAETIVTVWPVDKFDLFDHKVK